MAKLTILVGVLLILVGLGGYAVSDSAKPMTALIPSAIGTVFIFFGALLLIDNKVLRIIIAHLALVFALLLPLSIIGRWFTTGMGTPLALLSQIITIVILWGYVALGIKSFINARRARKEAVPGFDVVQ